MTKPPEGEKERDAARAVSKTVRGPHIALEKEVDLSKAHLAELRTKVDDLTPYAFFRRDADRMADEIDVLVRKHVIDARSPAADALLSYRSGNPSTETSTRIVQLENQNRDLTAQLRKQGEYRARAETGLHGSIVELRKIVELKAPTPGRPTADEIGVKVVDAAWNEDGGSASAVRRHAGIMVYRERVLSALENVEIYKALKNGEMVRPLVDAPAVSELVQKTIQLALHLARSIETCLGYPADSNVQQASKDAQALVRLLGLEIDP